MPRNGLPLNDNYTRKQTKAYKDLVSEYWLELKKSSELPTLKPRNIEVFKNVYDMSLEDYWIRKQQPQGAGILQSVGETSYSMEELRPLKAAIDRQSLRRVRLELGPGSDEIHKLRIRSKETFTRYLKDFFRRRILYIVECNLIDFVKSHKFVKELSKDKYRFFKYEILEKLRTEKEGAEKTVEDLNLPKSLKKPAKAYLIRSINRQKNVWGSGESCDVASTLYNLYNERKALESWFENDENKQELNNTAYYNLSLDELCKEFELKVEAKGDNPDSTGEIELADITEKTELLADITEQIELAKERKFVSLGWSMLTRLHTVLGYAIEKYSNAPKNHRKVFLDIIEEILIHDGKCKFNGYKCQQPSWELIQLMSKYANPVDEDTFDMRLRLMSYSQRAVAIDNSLLMGSSMFSKGLRFLLYLLFSKKIFKERQKDAGVLVMMLSAQEPGSHVIPEADRLYQKASRGPMGCSTFWGPYGEERARESSMSDAPPISFARAGAITSNQESNQETVPLLQFTDDRSFYSSTRTLNR